jgi:hypothetical protein
MAWRQIGRPVAMGNGGQKKVLARRFPYRAPRTIGV